MKGNLSKKKGFLGEITENNLDYIASKLNPEYGERLDAAESEIDSISESLSITKDLATSNTGMIELYGQYLDGKENKENKVNSINTQSPSEEKYPSEYAVNEYGKTIKEEILEKTNNKEDVANKIDEISYEHSYPDERQVYPSVNAVRGFVYETKEALAESYSETLRINYYSKDDTNKLLDNKEDVSNKTLGGNYPITHPDCTIAKDKYYASLKYLKECFDYFKDQIDASGGGGNVDLSNYYNIDEVNKLFIDKVEGNNILPPDYELGYYDHETGLEVANAGRNRTPSAIPLKDDVNRLYVYENCGKPYGNNENTNIVICYYNDNNEYLGYSNGVIPFPSGDVWITPVVQGAKKFKVWIGTVTEDVNLSRVCISYTELDGFEPYVIPIPKMSETVNVLDSLFSDAGGHNILNPDLWEAGYFTETVGNPLSYVTTTAHIRTIEPIEIEQGKQQLFIYENSGTTSGSNTIMGHIAFLNSDGNFISGGSSYAPFTKGYWTLTIPANATSFEFYMRGYSSGYTFENMCISYEMLDGFETYTDKVVKVLNSENLSDGIAPLAGKTIVNFGDSIFGNYLTPNDISTEISNQTGAKVYNCAFGGCRMGKHSEHYDNFSMYKLADAVASGDFSAQDGSVGSISSQHASTRLSTLKSINFNDVDVITIAYGTNDFTGGNAIDDTENIYNTDTFCGALRYSIETLLTAYPHLKIVVCSPTWRFWNDNGEYTYDSDTHIINDCLLTDFVKATNDVCVEYKIPFIDNYYSLGFNKFTRTAYFSATDGTHPQLAGRKLIGQRIARKLIAESYDNIIA